ncbi:MAG: hypothetical protein PHS30_02780 [Bacteroidales bacterium]|nr:hypothetical protein [Bacteroidales bacterium]
MPDSSRSLRPAFEVAVGYAAFLCALCGWRAKTIPFSTERMPSVAIGLSGQWHKQAYFYSWSDNNEETDAAENIRKIHYISSEAVEIKYIIFSTLNYTNNKKYMKVILLIVNILLSSVSFAQLQPSGVYSLNGFDKNLDCDIYFFKNGRYYLGISENVTYDMIENLVFSYGKFSVNKNEVVLSDNLHNYRIILYADNNCLKVKKGFNFLLNKSFVFYSKTTGSEPQFVRPKLNRHILQQERMKYMQLHKISIPLYSGVYEDVQGFNLNIQKDKKYKLWFKGILLSEGEWNRDGNELTLFDRTLRQPFYVLIGEKKLISSLLPGDYSQCSLIRR